MIKPKLILFLCAISLTFINCVSENKKQERQILSLNGPWSFIVDSLGKGDGEKWGEKGLPQQMVRSVTVPHSWNVEKGLERYWGKCWYERKIEIPAELLNQVTRLQFNGINHDAFIYINGKKAGEHTGSGYNRFYLDISPFLHEGANSVVVCVDNSPSRSNIPFLKSYDWSHDGGIYRGVQKIITGKDAIRNIHITAMPEGVKGTASIKVMLLNNVTDLPKLSLKATITEENQSTQNKIYEGELGGRFENGSVLCTLKFDSINPWHFDSPNLYRLNVKLLVDGLEKDAYSTVFGFRSIAVSSNRYVLNGEPIRLMGVEWMPGSNLSRGMAETPQDLEKNLKLLKNVNCIFTRFHWQQDEYIFDWCDRNGILIQEEIPYWGGTTIINDTLLRKGFEHLDEMIDAQFNHPSLIAWGIGNELQAHNPVNKASLKKLYDHAKELDPSRLVNYVTNNLHFGFPSEGKSLPDASADFDMMMFNEYFSTWYRKSVDVVPGQLDKIASEYPGKPLTIAEWGVCEPVHKGGDKRRVNEMVKQISIYGSKPYVAGAIYFCLNDYRTQMGEDNTYSYPQRVHGVCDINLNTKPSYDTLKVISSPVEIKGINRSNGKTVLTLYGKEGVPSYTIRNYTVQAGNEKMSIKELKPGESKQLEIDPTVKDIQIIRPTGYKVLELKLQ